MALLPALWMRRNLSVYFDNPTAVRDFRSQLRGTKALILWGVYLLILMAIGLTAYSAIAGGQNSSYQYGPYSSSIVVVQERLREFYTTISMLLAVMVSVITPAMTASAITSEHQRKSLDLVFSAPVEPKKLLVGKMISSFRYTWMLLILSLPVAAVCVVMGGATWVDVLSLYVLLSCNAIVFTSVGLLLSTLCKSTAAAISWTYLVVVLYLFFTGTTAGITSASGSGGLRAGEAPWILTLNPFFAVYAAPTHSVLWGHAVPNWIICIVATLAISKIFLLGAASQLSAFGSRERLSLRIHGLVYAFLVSMFLGSTLSISMSLTSFLSITKGLPLAIGIAALCASMLFFVPTICCYGWDGGRQYRNDGRFSLKNAFLGTPAGSFVYLTLLSAAILAGGCAGSALVGQVLPVIALKGGLWGLCYLVFWWALSRWLSARSGNLKQARTSTFAAMVVLLGLPIPVLSIFQTSASASGSEKQFMPWQLLYPLWGEAGMNQALIYAGAMVALASLLILSERSNKPPRHIYRAHNE